MKRPSLKSDLQQVSFSRLGMIPRIQRGESLLREEEQFGMFQTMSVNLNNLFHYKSKHPNFIN